MELFEEFPEMGRSDQRDFKKAIDAGFRNFSRAYGESLESFFDPLLQFMIWFEKLLINSPWPLVLIVIGLLAWLGSRSFNFGRRHVSLFCCHRLFWNVGKYYGNVGDNIGCYVHLHRRWYTARHLDGKIKSRSSSNNTDPRCNADDPQLRLFNTSGDASGHWKSTRFNCGLYLCSSTDCALDQPRDRLVDEEVLGGGS